MSDVYHDPIAQKVIEFLDEHGPSRLQGNYVNGDVLSPNKSDLPLCYITRDTVNLNSANNMEDEHNLSMVAVVIYDWTEELDQASDMVAGIGGLMEMVEARDENTFLLKEDTLLYQLRKRQSLADKLWIGLREGIRAEYGLGIQRRGPNIYSVEAVIRFTVTAHLENPEFY